MQIDNMTLSNDVVNIFGDVDLNKLIITGNTTLMITGSLLVNYSIYINLTNTIPTTFITTSSCIADNMTLDLNILVTQYSGDIIQFNCDHIPVIQVVANVLNDSCTGYSCVTTEKFVTLRVFSICTTPGFNTFFIMPLVVSVVGFIILISIIYAIVRHFHFKKIVNNIKRPMFDE